MLNQGLSRVDKAADEKLATTSRLFAGRDKKSYTGGSSMCNLVKTGKEIATASTKSVGLAGGFLKVKGK
jgi:hypothetical protein